MCNNKTLFLDLTDPPKNRFVILGDESSKVPIKGIGTIEVTVADKKIRLHNVLFCPVLDVSLFSTKQHMKYVGCWEMSRENMCTLAFLSCTFHAITDNEIHFMVQSNNTHYTVTQNFDDHNATIFTKHKNSIAFTHPNLNSRQEVEISSIHKTKRAENPPSHHLVALDMISIPPLIPPSHQTAEN